ncbi:MAG TPA: cyclic nucleotide-binding domain-containing protein [Fimbriimonadaceae bacterium]|nr:cyclic nucleotide-binding domain-containing protein [Fimbriimonadaceae bacterium]
MELPQALRDNYLFRGLSDSHIDTIFRLATVKLFMGGDTIVRQFGRDHDLMIVLRGNVQIKTFSGDVIAEVGPGSVLGEVSLIDDEPRSATVVSRGESQVAVIPANDLRDMMKHDLGMKCVMLENLSRVLCQRIRSANMQLDGMMAGTPH